MNKKMEKPFELLRRMGDNTAFHKDIVKNWYLARSYVLKQLENTAFGPDSKEHLHVVVDGDDERMLSIVRQVALSAHYINFNEGYEGESPCNRTVITIVSKNPNIKEELEKEEFLCNLPKYCKFVNKDLTAINDDSHIDIEIHIVDVYHEKPEEKNLILFTIQNVDEYWNNESNNENILSIDTRKAYYASRMYNIGEAIDNLPAEDIHCAKRYTIALNIFQYNILKEDPLPMFNKSDISQLNIIKEKLSNIFCTDCFESRKLSIQQCEKKEIKKEIELWEEQNEALSRSEHARWVVEKLIMGYSPLSVQQRFEDECWYYNKKRKVEYRKQLKRQDHNPVHIDLCSYADLRRINPDDLKYDSFLMLAIPKILDKVEQYKNKYKENR